MILTPGSKLGTYEILSGDYGEHRIVLEKYVSS